MSANRNHAHYLFKRTPSYQETQQDYIAQVERIVMQTVEKLRSAVTDNQDLITFFHHELNILSSQRQRLAFQHQTVDSEMFGIRRDSQPSEKYRYSAMQTNLCYAYEEYGERLIKFIHRQLQTLPRSLIKFNKTELTLPAETCAGRQSSMQISIFNLQNKEKWKSEGYSKEDYLRICRFASVIPKVESEEEIFSQRWLNDIVNNMQAMQELKRNSLDDYKQLKLYQCMTDCQINLAGKKSDWVLVTPRMEINGKMYGLTQYLTWMYKDHRIDPVDRMIIESKVSLLHQDSFLIDAMLNDIAELFKKSIEWNGENINELMQTVALLMYEFSHAMPYKRGSAAISEWIEMIIYHYHGFSVEYNDRACINMEALTTRMKEFIEGYPQMIKLHRISKESNLRLST